MQITHKPFRKGSIGALLDEYEKALLELNLVIKNLNSSELLQVVDPNTKDKDCLSIQSILTHIIQSGYTYITEISNWMGVKQDYKEKIYYKSITPYLNDLELLFLSTEDFFIKHPNIKLIEMDNNKKIIARWGQSYDVEQLLQHAIVHVLRHRRQIESFIQIINLNKA